MAAAEGPFLAPDGVFIDFGQLPDGVFCQVFSHLGFQDQLAVSTVCKRFNTLLKAHPELFKEVIVDFRCETKEGR